jgi:chromosome segregation ATPase
MEALTLIGEALNRLKVTQVLREEATKNLDEKLNALGLLNEQAQALEASRGATVEEIQALRNNLTELDNVEKNQRGYLESLQALLTPVEPAPVPVVEAAPEPAPVEPPAVEPAPEPPVVEEVTPVEG